MERVANDGQSGRVRAPLPSPTMPTFLTVKEAAKLTGKSPSSIRRVIYPIIQDDNHADRLHIEPTVDNVKKLRLKGENFAWRISEELLRLEVPVETEKPAGDERVDSLPRTAGDIELLAMLHGELDIKNHQITQHSELISKQMELISGLSERLREGNVLIGSLQQRFALPDAANRTREFVDAGTSAVEAPDKKKSSRWFGRFFRAA